MSYVLKCDRCGKVVENLNGCGKIIAKEILKRYLPRDREVTEEIGTFDLCHECKRKFNDWMYGNKEESK